MIQAISDIKQKIRERYREKSISHFSLGLFISMERHKYTNESYLSFLLIKEKLIIEVLVQRIKVINIHSLYSLR